jgi:hypothetical protein
VRFGSVWRRNGATDSLASERVFIEIGRVGEKVERQILVPEVEGKVGAQGVSQLSLRE